MDFFNNFLHESFHSPITRNNSSSNRIEFIDLAKGICILLVVLLHFNDRWFNLPNLTALRMPLYFTLSGLFFKWV